MWTALRDLFGSLTPTGRFWLAVAILAALLALLIVMLLRGVDVSPLWAILGG